MTTLKFKGNQIGEALQFQSQGGTTTVEVGRVWFAATDTVTITFAPGAIGPDGSIVGGNGAVTALSVKTAGGAVTTFFPSPNGLDIDPDGEKNGADFLYISESPDAGVGGAYAGLQLEKIVVSDVPLQAGANVPFSNIGSYVGANGPVTQPPVLIGDAGNNTLTGTSGNDRMDGRQGNDTMRSLGGNDTVLGGEGNERIDAGAGNDVVRGGDGNDLALGQAGNDRLLGEFGNDLLDGGAGRDILTGGVGGDKFVFGAGDVVTDFNASAGDQILFDASLGLDLDLITIRTTATRTTISYNGETMVLQGASQPFDAGNAIKFDYVQTFDFI